MLQNDKIERLSGVFSPVVTPYRSDFSPDEIRLVRQCHWLISNNVGLAIFGTNSEGNSLSVSEKIKLLDFIVSKGVDPKWLMPGSGCCALSDTIELTSHATDLGCGGVLMLPPFYYKEVSEDGLYASYSEVIQKVGSSNLRIYLYHIPPVAQVGITISLIERLLKEYPNIVVGIKDSSNNWNNTKKMLDCNWDDFRIFVGSESFLLANMQHGGSGCISATANVNPSEIFNLFAHWQDAKAVEWQKKLNEIRDTFNNYSVIPALKQCVAHYTNDKNWKRLRPPLMELSDEDSHKLIEELQVLNFSMPGLKEYGAL